MTEEDLLNSKILVVDDEPANVALVGSYLRKNGFKNILTSTDSRQVMNLYSEHWPDLVILDLKMPHMDGFQVIDALHKVEKRSYLPVLVMTALIDNETRLDALKKGAKDFITKPLNYLEMLYRVRNMLEIRLLHNEVRNYNRKLESTVNHLTRTGVTLAGEKDFNQLSELIVTQARALTAADGGMLYLREQNDLALRIVQIDSLELRLGGHSGAPIDMSRFGDKSLALIKKVAAEKRTLLFDGDCNAVEFDCAAIEACDRALGYRTQSLLAVPMRNHEDDVAGVLLLMNCRDAETGETVAFTRDQVTLVESVAAQAAMAVINTDLMHGVERLFEAFVEVMAAAIDEKSPVTGGHIRRVADLALKMAEVINEQKNGHYREVRFSDDQLYQLKLAAYMHDLGKVTSPVEIIEKANKLQTIFDRIHYVDLRLLYIIEKTKRLAVARKVDVLQNGSEPEKLRQIDEEMRLEVARLAEIREFLKKCNVPMEYLEDEKIARLRTIATLTYQDEDGLERPLLTGDELTNLSIRKGSITETERKKMQDHAAITVKMLNRIPFTRKLKDVPRFAGTHHEHINGTGYPFGLKGEEIPLEGRLLAVVDIAEALTAPDRPYKKAMPLSAAFSIMRKMAQDGVLDPGLVDLFINEKVYERYLRDMTPAGATANGT